MRIDILTIFPEMFSSPFEQSILKRAITSGLVDIRIHNIRDYSHDKHRMTDDYPYGGGGGMLMKPEPIIRGVESIKRDNQAAKVVLMTPQGIRYTQQKAVNLARSDSLIFICGRYEGVDERVREFWVDEEISIGDYVLTGGELAAMVVIDAVVRLIPGALGGGETADSFYEGLLEYPQYTRPRCYRGMMVPEVLLSGNHQEIAIWRRKESLKRTTIRRPDLLKEAKISKKDEVLLAEIKIDLKQG